MPGFATSQFTLSNARRLMDALEVSGSELDIRPAATQMLRDLGHPAAEGEEVYDVTYENVQAGERTSHLFRLANYHRALVVGTGDLSELALGWSTYGVGDQMSHYNVNASVPKTLIQFLIRWEIDIGLFAPDAAEVLERFDGLLLMGGGDLHPEEYGQERRDEIYGVIPHRDRFELALARAAVDRRLPTLAICRGHQVLNVALGGSLDQHITDRDGVLPHGKPGVPGGSTVHDIELEPGSRLAAAMGVTHASCSSHHHQAVEHPGGPLLVLRPERCLCWRAART